MPYSPNWGFVNTFAQMASNRTDIDTEIIRSMSSAVDKLTGAIVQKNKDEDARIMGALQNISKNYTPMDKPIEGAIPMEDVLMQQGLDPNLVPEKARKSLSKYFISNNTLAGMLAAFNAMQNYAKNIPEGVTMGDTTKQLAIGPGITVPAGVEGTKPKYDAAKRFIDISKDIVTKNGKEISGGGTIAVEQPSAEEFTAMKSDADLVKWFANRGYTFGASKAGPSQFNIGNAAEQRAENAIKAANDRYIRDARSFVQTNAKELSKEWKGVDSAQKLMNFALEANRRLQSASNDATVTGSISAKRLIAEEIKHYREVYTQARQYIDAVQKGDKATESAVYKKLAQYLSSWAAPSTQE